MIFCYQLNICGFSQNYRASVQLYPNESERESQSKMRRQGEFGYGALDDSEGSFLQANAGKFSISIYPSCIRIIIIFFP